MNNELFEEFKDLLKKTLGSILETEFEDKPISRISVVQEEEDTEDAIKFLMLIEKLWNDTYEVTEEWDDPVHPYVFNGMLQMSVDLLKNEGEENEG